MKTFSADALVVLALVAGATAQDPPTTTAIAVLGTDGVYTITEYTPDCSTGGLGGLGSGSGGSGTVMGTITNDLPCDECDHKTGIWTTYTTVYLNTCSTGETSVTYTVTESCTEENQPRPSDYVPSGFTVTTVACDKCEHPTVTLTTPCSETASTTPTPSPGPAGSAPPAAPAPTGAPSQGPTAPASPPASSAPPAPPGGGSSPAPPSLPPSPPTPAPPAGGAPPSSPPGSPPPAAAPAPPAGGSGPPPAMNTSTLISTNPYAPLIAIGKASLTDYSPIIAFWAAIVGLFALF